jgi:signal transduction histidine kinase
MDQDVYTRLVATHVPLAILPRREATCAHTINQPSGMTLSLPDMPADPRFARSPHVAEAGLVSYVGASLRFSISRENGEPQEVVLGTLCAANFTAGHDLSPLQQRALVRFADMIVHEIIERARNVRATERHFMASRLTSISNEVNAANAVDVVLGSLREAYPDVDVSIQHRPDDSILLNGIGPVPYHKFKHYLYEDTAQIEASILACNHLPPDALPNTRTLRAIAIKRSAVPHTYLVMQSARLTHIFDDIDAAFAHSCALVLCNVHQAAELERATAARSAFLRGVSHELRTPIHALLSSCELLVEDARTARHKLSAQFAAGGGKGAEEHATLLENAIASGRQLMATVNNLLNVDALGALVPAPAPFALAALEAALISQVGTTLRGRGGGVQVVCEHLLPPDVHVLVSDFDLLKQALTALLDNAIAFTTSGTITLRTALEGGDDTHLGALVFDVVDTGHGIATEVQASLFDAPQKGSGGGDGTSSAVGLGLAVARRITDALGGALDLRHSNANGSSFRLRLEAPVLACQRGHPARRVAQSKRLRTFAITAAPDGARTAGLRAALVATGLKETTQRTASVLVVDAGTVPPLQGEQVALMLHAEDAVPVSSPRMVPVVEPICAEVLWAAFSAVLDLCEQDVSMVSSPSSSISTCASPSASVLTHSTMSSAAYSAAPAPTRATLKILIVDDNVRERGRDGPWADADTPSSGRISTSCACTAAAGAFHTFRRLTARSRLTSIRLP